MSRAVLHMGECLEIQHGRGAIHVDLNPEYLDLARERIGPLLCDVVAA